MNNETNHMFRILCILWSILSGIVLLSDFMGDSVVINSMAGALMLFSAGGLIKPRIFSFLLATFWAVGIGMGIVAGLLEGHGFTAITVMGLVLQFFFGWLSLTAARSPDVAIGAEPSRQV